MQENNAFTAFYIGDMLEKQNRNGLAWLERSTELAPDNLDFNTRLANAYMKYKRYPDAKMTYKNVIKKNNREIMALVNLGFIYQLEKNFPKALELTNQALALDPLYLRARENKINVLLNMGDFGLAAEYLDELIKDYPDNRQYGQLMDRINELVN
jgi:tetratricopeptide (TPR) repeat protein